MDINVLFQQAVHLHQAGELTKAETAYKRILSYLMLRLTEIFLPKQPKDGNLF